MTSERDWNDRPAVRIVIEGMINRQQLTSCLCCEHYNEKTAGCKKAEGRIPPPEVAVYGCDYWQQLIPF